MLNCSGLFRRFRFAGAAVLAVFGSRLLARRQCRGAGRRIDRRIGRSSRC